MNLTHGLGLKAEQIPKPHAQQAETANAKQLTAIDGVMIQPIAGQRALHSCLPC
jgi:hypothetical protein